MVIPFHTALQQAQAAYHWTPKTMSQLSNTPLSTMYRWLSGSSVPDLKTMVSACQALGIDPEKVVEGRAPRYHQQILSIDSLQARYQEQFAIDPKLGGITAAMAGLATYHEVLELGVMSVLVITHNGEISINPSSPDGAGCKLEIAVQDGRLVLVVKTNSGQTLSTEVLSEAAVKTAVEMIA